MNKTRVHKLEKKIHEKNSTYITPKFVTLCDGAYTTQKGEPLIKDKDGNLSYEDGAPYYEVDSYPGDQRGLISIEFIAPLPQDKDLD